MLYVSPLYAHVLKKLYIEIFYYLYALKNWLRYALSSASLELLRRKNFELLSGKLPIYSSNITRMLTKIVAKSFTHRRKKRQF